VTGNCRPVAAPQLVSADVATALQSGRSGLFRPVGVRKAAARWSLPSMLTNDVLYGHAGCRSIGDTWGRRRSQVFMSNTGEIARADHGGRRGNAGHCVEFGHGSRCCRWCWVTGVLPAIVNTSSLRIVESSEALCRYWVVSRISESARQTFGCRFRARCSVGNLGRRGSAPVLYVRVCSRIMQRRTSRAGAPPPLPAVVAGCTQTGASISRISPSA
jgi:hypothetical protein